MNSQLKSDYDGPETQISNPNLPIVAQPMSNMGNQIVQTPYGQTLMVTSNGTMLSPSQGQIYTQYTPSAQSGSYSIQPANAIMVNPYSGQHSAQSVPSDSYVNQMPSQSATVNSNTGQVTDPTTLSAESGVNQASKVNPPPLSGVTSHYQKPLPPINKPQSEPSQTDDRDINAMDDPPKPENQQNDQNF